MDRTIIAPYRAEEKELSLILYNKLQGLAQLHPPTEDLKKCLSDEMFVKPNQQAFFQVMHYLFRLLDPNEFRKRFYWPITDKRSESNFRTSTVEYLKYLNEKHQLNWTHIKSYLVVMPGGMKFICFLLDFVHFIVQELIKQKEKQLNVDSTQYRELVTDENLQKMCKQDTLAKEMASEFLASIDVINKRYMEKVQLLSQYLEELAGETDLNVDTLIDDRFLIDFEDSNAALFEKRFVVRTQNILEMEQHVVALKESMDRFYSKESGFKYEPQKVRQQLRSIRDNFALENLSEASILCDDSVNINTLIKAFNSINETVQNELSAADKRPRAGIVKTRLSEVEKDLRQIESQITDFLMVIKSRRKKRNDDIPRTPVRHSVAHASGGTQFGSARRNLENNLLLKYVSTPPIKFEMSEGQHGPSRLSLIDSKSNANANVSTFNSFLAPPRTIRQPRLNCSLADQSNVDLNSSMNRSKLIDPMQLLRSINKDSSKVVTTPKSNISGLGSRWKERQSLLADRDDEIPTIIVTDSPNGFKTPCTSKADSTTIARRQSLFSDMADISTTSTVTKKSSSFATSSGSPTMVQSPFTPFNSNERTRIARTSGHIWDNNSYTTSGNSSSSTSWSGMKKIGALKKVQDASMNFANLSTSPSGRLEPLVTAQDFNIPKLQLNDNSMIDHNVSCNNNSLIGEHSNDDNCSQRSPFTMLLNKEDENDVLDACKNSPNPEGLLQDDEDALFNISDSVLKDVTM
ncbi:augmin complex subunit dgt6-like [Musca domestica]|uniref:Augmin complex subunit dgt6-like n=1 Tax=Musca domestica TaxID=7370 RepID=A0ABM3V6J8_MUSDO|nr:augmin complex subunit dgt6-like [Musca domestica]